MKVIYIADDGKEFTDEYECLEYEWKLNHPYLKDVCCYDENNNKLDNILSEETYYMAEKVVVLNENVLKDFQELADYTGYCCYADINECGEWLFDIDKGTYVKVKEIL